ncbi:MAG: hypothetical protein AAGI30_07200 [Planctomycetota bacterium]
MLTIGLDVHQAFTAACVLDGGGRVIKNRSIRGDWRLSTRSFEDDPLSHSRPASGTNYNFGSRKVNRNGTDQQVDIVD